MTEAERSIIGCIFLSEAPILSNLVAAGLSPIHFADPKCRAAFEIMLSLGADKAMDVALVSQAARERGGLGKDFSHFLASIIDAPPARQEAEYTRLVIDASRRRELLRAVTKAHQILEAGAGLREAVSTLDEALRFVTASEPASLTSTPKTILPFTLLPHTDPIAKSQQGVMTGFRDLDAELQGIRPKQLLVLGARPGMGKTIFAQNIAENAVMAGKRVLFFTLEMDPTELADRYLASRATLSYSAVRARIITEADRASVRLNTALWTDRLVWHRGTRLMGVADVVAHSRAASERYGKLDLVVVDYLGKLRPRLSGSASLNERVGEVASDLKAAAKELDLPILAIQQLNRQVESRTGKVPQLSDLRDSGMVEQEADIILLLGDEEGLRKDITVHIAKNRNGRLGGVKMNPEFQYQRFVNACP